MRKGLLVVIVLIAAVLALPRVFAGLTESQVTTRIAEINEGDVLSVALDDYSRGWFSSRARVSIRLSPESRARAAAGDADAPEALSRALPVVVELAHGPAGFKQGPFLGLSKFVAYADPEVAWVRELIDTYGLPYLFEFRGRTDFTGRVSFDADIPPVDTAATGGYTRFSGMRIEGTQAGRRLIARLDADELDVSAPGASILMSGVHAETNTRFTARDRTAGALTVEIGEIGFAVPSSPDAGRFQIAGVRMTTEAEIEDGAWQSRLDLTTESIVTADGQRIESAVLSAGMEDLDAAALEELQALLDGSVDPPAPDAASPELEDALSRILAGSPSLEIAHRFTWDGDTFDATLRLDVHDDASLNVAQIDSVLSLLELFDGALDVTVAKPLARRLATNAARAQLALQQDADPSQSGQLAETQATLMLVMLAGQGYLEETEDAYSTRILLTNGDVTINGRPMPLLGSP